MAVINSPRYMSFDHLYVETVTVTNPANLNLGVAANRFVTRTGAYPAAGGYAAGVSIYDIYGPGVLTGYESVYLSGTDLDITPTSAGATTGDAVGTGTSFESELVVGSIIEIAGVQYRVVSIADDLNMVVERVDGAVVTAVTDAVPTTGVKRLSVTGGYQVEYPSGLSPEYESRFNASTTPFAPRVFPYQKNLSVVTSGIAIVQVDPLKVGGVDFSVDDAVYAAASGYATTTVAGDEIILGRSLDNLTTAEGDVGYIRVRLAGVAN